MTKVYRFAFLLSPARVLLPMMIALISLGLAGCPEASKDNPPQQTFRNRANTLRVLFLGNSHTSMHDVPLMVKRYAEAGGECELVTKTEQGIFLEFVCQRKDIQDEVKNGDWDVVVMQGQKISMSGKYEYSTKDAEEFATLANQSGAQVIWYSEWGRRGVEGETERTEAVYQQMAKINGDTVAPVGQVWLSAMSRRDDLNMFFEDGNHQNKDGAQLSALVLFVSITGKDCSNIPNVEFKDANIELQPFFRTVVSEHFAIKRVLEADSKLGAVRNNGCKKKSLSDTVKQYVEDMKKIDFDGCPDEFQKAFESHIVAWEASIPFFDGFPELRGEMHDLFEEIRANGGTAKSGIEEVEKGIWGTWGDVESATR